MSVYRDSQRVPTTIFETAALHFTVKVHCSRCRNAGLFEPAGLWWRFRRKGWADHFGLARERFWCLRCAIGGGGRTRPSFLEAVRDRPLHYLEPPPEREWKSAIKRFRT